MVDPLALIDRIEPAGALARMSLYGIDVWPVIRVRLAEPGSAATPPERRLGAGQAWALVSGLAGLMFDSARALFRPAGPAGRCVFFTHVACLARFEGRWHDRYCDPIADALERRGMRSVVLEYSPDLSGRAPVARPRLSITLALVLAKVVSVPMAWAGRQLLRGRFARIDAAMRAEGIAHTLDPIALNRLLAYIWCARALLTLLLRLHRASLAFVCCYYSSSAMAFVLACRRLGVEVYDIQHGVQGARHLSYRAWRAPAGRGFAALPSGFWCWDAATATALNTWCRAELGLHAVVGGNVWVEYLLGKRGAAADSGRGAASKKTVLVSLQPLAEPLRPALLDAIGASAQRIDWVVRTHPAMTAARNAELAQRLAAFGAAVRVQTDADEPLPLVLAGADLHLTEYSSVVIEATACGVPSVVLDARALALYPAEQRSGQMVLAQDADQILRCVETMQRRAGATAAPGLIDSALDEIFKRKGWA